MADAVRYDVDAGVATITLNRPEALNSLTTEAKEQLLAALRRAGDDEAVRAVLLTGAGRGFCAGQDLREHAAALGAAYDAAGMPADGGQPGGSGVPPAAADALETVRSHFNPIVVALTGMPKPVVAAVNGIAAGAGASLAFACDFRLAAESASFLMAFARVGLGPDTGASWTLPRLVGWGRAAAMLMLAEPVPAAQALEMGLVNAVVADDRLPATAAEFAGRLAAGPTAAYAAIKRALYAAAGSDLAAALELEAQLQSELGSTRDHAAAVTAFVNKEQPVFTGH